MNPVKLSARRRYAVNRAYPDHPDRSAVLGIFVGAPQKNTPTVETAEVV